MVPSEVYWCVYAGKGPKEVTKNKQLHTQYLYIYDIYFFSLMRNRFLMKRRGAGVRVWEQESESGSRSQSLGAGVRHSAQR